MQTKIITATLTCVFLASPATTAIYAELASPVAKQVVNALQTPGVELGNRPEEIR
jgi:hypothetical protein